MTAIESDLRLQLNQALASEGIEVRGKVTPQFSKILSPGALQFVGLLAKRFGGTRLALLQQRERRQAEFNGGALPDFLRSTSHIRSGDWKVDPAPSDLQDRRVEITGPTSRKMIINALNSGANCFMADLEDSLSPTWVNVIDGQINLRDAVYSTISFTGDDGKTYTLNEKTAVLIVRPRGWHLPEAHVLVRGQPISASLFDFGLYFYHNAKKLLEKGTGPYFYLPKMESHLEARLWNDVFCFAEDTLHVARGTIKTTVLIETILAAFEMDEILYELREHCVGLNCGRWDYIFSFIKKFHTRPEFVLPDRSQVSMTQPFMQAYVDLLIYTCHKRGAHAMGGMAAQIPIRNDEKGNLAAMEKVRADKLREVKAGHDGTWVAHPGLVKIAKEVFDQHMRGPNQLHVKREDVGRAVMASEPSSVVGKRASDLLKIPTGTITEEGVRHNVSAALQYMEAWLRGNGCVPISNLMEDAATAEIARSQLWSWVHHRARFSHSQQEITAHIVEETVKKELQLLRKAQGSENNRFSLAARLLLDLILRDDYVDFLTLPAYEYVKTVDETSKL